MAQMWSEDRLKTIIRGGETQYVDFKQQWYDLSKNEGKGELARDVLAMANTATADDSGLLVIGVQDDGKIIGASAPPAEESVAQILSNYIMPPAAFLLLRVMAAGLPVDLIEVPQSRQRPHFANRDTNAMKVGVAYARRGATIGILSVPEVVAMSRELNFAVKPDTIELGFVEYMNWSAGHMVARIKNLTDTPIDGIQVMLEITPRLRPTAMKRQTILSNAVLEPNQSREFPLHIVDLISAPSSLTEKNAERFDPRGNLRHRWLDVTLYLTYRDPFGYLKSEWETVCLGD